AGATSEKSPTTAAEKSRAPAAEPKTAAPAPPTPKPVGKVALAQPVETPAPAPPDGHTVAAGPATRHLARELGVDLHLVGGTGPSGRVTQEDIKAHVRRLGTQASAGAVAAPPLPRFEEFGPVEREPLSRIRQLTARQMSLAWSVIPHVTQHDEADITDLE